MRAQASGQVRTDFSPERLARVLANTCFITALQWAAYRQGRSVHDEFRVALRLSLEGLRSSAESHGGQPESN